MPRTDILLSSSPWIPRPLPTKPLLKVPPGKGWADVGAGTMENTIRSHRNSASAAHAPFSWNMVG